MVRNATICLGLVCSIIFWTPVSAQLLDDFDSTSSEDTAHGLVINSECETDDPIVITVDDLASGAYECNLVKIEGVYINRTDNTLVPNSTYLLTDESGEGNLRMLGSNFPSTIPLPSMPVTVVGLASSFSSIPQLEPRSEDDFIEDFGGDDISLAETLDIWTWNIEWFGSTSNGPSNRDLQRSHAITMIETETPDLIAVQEISDVNYFHDFVDMLDDYRGFLTNFSQTQKTGYIYRVGVIDSVDSRLISDGQSSYDWAGRLPYKFVFDAIIQEDTTRFYSYNLHAKAIGNESSWIRRNNASGQLESYLETNRTEDEYVIILGDFNDFVIGSTWTSAPESPYKNFVDNGNFDVLSYTLQEKGGYSFASFSFRSLLDHFIVSSNMSDAFISESIRTFVPSYIGNFLSDASDHYPVYARYDISLLGRGIGGDVEPDPDPDPEPDPDPDPDPELITIAEARDLGVGATVTIRGVVTRSYRNNTYIQDESAALMIRQSSGTMQFRQDVNDGTITEGVELEVSGRISTFNGLLQINDSDLDSYSILSTDQPLPRPRYLSLEEVLYSDGSYMSQLVRVPDLSFFGLPAGGFQSSTTYYVVDNSLEDDSVPFRVGSTNESRIIGENAHEGTFTFTGIIGYFQGEDQLMPIELSDLRYQPHATLPGTSNSWHMLGSPGNSATYSGAFEELHTQGFPGSDNENADPNVFYWDYEDEWQVPSSAENQIGTGSNGTSEPGRGAIVYVFEDDLKTYAPGWPKSIWSDASEQFEDHTVDLSTDPSVETSWHLLANPFPFPLYWDEIYMTSFTKDVSSFVYVWDSEFQNYRLNDRFGIHTSLPDNEQFNGVLAPFQGFWVEATSAEAELYFNEFQNATESPSQLYSEESVEIPLSISVKSENGSSRIYALDQPVHISKAPEFTNDVPHTYWVQNDKKYLIQPIDRAGLTFEIKLNEDQIELSLDTPSWMSEETFYLEDQRTGDFHKIYDGNSVTISGRAGEVVSMELTGDQTTSTNPEKELPQYFSLQQNYPNPFNPVTQIAYALPEESHITLTVYNALGQRVAVLADEVRAAGHHSATFDAANLSSGLYIYRLQTSGKILTRQMMLIK